MLILLSPAKSLDFESAPITKTHTKPQFLEQSATLIDTLKGYTPEEIAKLMKISDKLAELNFQRYQDWSPPFSLKNAKQCLLAFNGDVYEGLDAQNFSEKDMNFAQEHLRILSGLYGSLRPLDLIQAYRLEMGTKLSGVWGKDLYAFWKESLAQSLNKDLDKIQSSTVINLASQEYFRSVAPKTLEASVITPVFKDWKQGKYKIVSFFAKKARGMMARHLIKKQAKTLKVITKFNGGGYAHSEKESTDKELVFLRRQ